MRGNPTETAAIGIDVGGTKIAGALVREDGEVLAAQQTRTQAEQGVPAVIERIADLVEGLVEAAPSTPAGIGIGTPGQVDPHEGIVHNAVNLGWVEVPLRRELNERLSFSIPVQIYHDSSASALGERYFGAAQGYDDFVYLGLGTGLGAAVVTGGRLVMGAAWSAAELGHMVIEEGGAPCACGLHGCAETILSGPGLVRLARQRLESGEGSPILSEGELTAESILRAAEMGDGVAREAVSEMGRALGKVMAITATVLNPALFVIGGGLGVAAFDQILPTALESLRRNSLPSVHRQVKVRPSSLASSAVGAAALVWYAAETDKNTGSRKKEKE